MDIVLIHVVLGGCLFGELAVERRARNLCGVETGRMLFRVCPVPAMPTTDFRLHRGCVCILHFRYMSTAKEGGVCGLGNCGSRTSWLEGLNTRRLRLCCWRAERLADTH